LGDRKIPHGCRGRGFFHGCWHTGRRLGAGLCSHGRSGCRRGCRRGKTGLWVWGGGRWSEVAAGGLSVRSRLRFRIGIARNQQHAGQRNQAKENARNHGGMGSENGRQVNRNGAFVECGL
jgi:hypothetical protein